MASVRKRTWRSGGQDKTAWVVDYFDQQGTRRLKTCRTKKEADEFRTTCSWEIRQDIHTPASASITVVEAVAMWLEHGEAEGLERGTLRTYDAVVRTHVLPVIGKCRLTQLAIGRELGVEVRIAYPSEREDWIQTMVMAGMGICFMPEDSAVVPGLQTRRVIDPEVVREVSLVTVAGRRFSPAVAAFVRAIKAYQWPTAAPDAELS